MTKKLNSTQNFQNLDGYTLRIPVPGSHSTFIASRENDEQEYVVKAIAGAFGIRQFETITDSLSFSRHTPRVCSVVELGVRQNTVFAVAPYIDGMSVAQILRRVAARRHLLTRSSSIVAATHLVAELSIALTELTLCPKSLATPSFFSPDRMFAARDGRAYVLDPRWVNLRRIADHPPSLRPLAHDFAYQLPEQFRPLVQPGGEAVWGLSVVLWELLTGYRLFRRDTLRGTIRALGDCRIPEPRELNAAISPDLSAWLKSTLEHPEAHLLSDFSDNLLMLAQASTRQGQSVMAKWLSELDPVQSRLEDEEVRSTSLSASRLSVPPSRLSASSSSEFDQLPWPQPAPRDSLQPFMQLDSSAASEAAPRRRGGWGFLAAGASVAGSALLLLRLQFPMPDFDGGPLAQTTFASNPAQTSTLQPVEAPLDMEDIPPPTQGPDMVEVPVFQLEDLDPPEENDVRPPSSSPTPAPAPLSEMDERAPAGILSVEAPDDVAVYDGEMLLGNGSFEASWPVGPAVFELHSPRAGIESIQVDLKPGARSVLSVADWF